MNDRPAREDIATVHGTANPLNVPLLKMLRALLAPVVRVTIRPLPIDDVPLSTLKATLKARGVRPVVPLTKITGYRFTKFGPNGNSPHQQASAIYLRTRSRAAVSEFLAGYLETHRPKSLAEMLFASNDPSL